jgi:hypothetical protein
MACNQSLNLQNTNWSNGLNYEAFSTDSHFLAVDLSASGNSGSSVLAPQVRKETGSLDIIFDRPTTIPLDVVCVIEMLASMDIDNDRSISMSYL